MIHPESLSTLQPAAQLYEGQPSVYDAEAGFATGKTLIAIGAVTVAAFGGVWGLGLLDKHQNESGAANAGNNTNTKYCSELTFSNAAADSTKYISEAGLPKSSVKSGEQVRPYIQGLFGKDGPLAGKGDAASLALVDGAITEPAQDHRLFDPKRSVIGAFDRKASEYSGPNGATTAANDCVATYNVLTQVSTYNEKWAAKGAKVVIFKANRDAANKITGFTAENYVAAADLTGIELKFQNTNKSVDDFGDYLISTAPGTEGDLLTHGTITEPQQSKQSIKQEGQKLTPAQKKEVAKAAESQQSKQGNSNQQNVTSNTGHAPAGSQSHNNSNNGGGNTVGNSTGNTTETTGGTSSGSTSGTTGSGTSGSTGGSTGGSSGTSGGSTGGSTGGTSGSTGGSSGTSGGSTGGSTGGTTGNQAPSPAPQESQPAPQPSPRETQPAPQPSPRETQPAPQPSPNKSSTPCDPNTGDVC